MFHQNTSGHKSVSCQELRVSISKYGGVWRGGGQTRNKGVMFISLGESNCNGIPATGETVVLCQSAGIMHDVLLHECKGMNRKGPEEEMVISSV